MTAYTIRSLPHRLSDSAAAQTAFSSLSADEREDFAASFEGPHRAALPDNDSERIFMQISQNSVQILY
ncbi:MAG: hypothetical protein K6B74_04865 [Ruminococcus sp.]|nr:hypothetical protein [Ruminococcus sp.]